ncbi:MAG TPA: hypothetical protein VIS07_09180 [Candidatus Binatia bacterium]
MDAVRDRTSAARRTARTLLALLLLPLALIAGAPWPSPAQAGVDLVRLEGVLRETNPPGTMVQTTLAVGDQSIPFAVYAARRISGDPFEGPGVLLALGPGPPPIRVEGRDETVGQLTSAAPGTRVSLTGSLNVGSAFLTLMSVEVVPSPAPSAAPSPSAAQ